MLLIQSVLLVNSSMHWPKEDVCTLNVTSVLLSFAVDVVIYLRRYENVLYIWIVN